MNCLTLGDNMLQKRIRYHTMSSWNRSKAPAYNMKIPNVIKRNLQDRAFELMETEDFYFEINQLISDFNAQYKQEWQAGFNGRSGGYLVLYRGGQKPSGYKSHCTECWQGNFKTVEDRGYNKCGRCGKNSLVNDQHVNMTTFTYPGKNIDDDEVPGAVLKEFRRLAQDIVKNVQFMAESCTVEEEQYTVTKTRKVTKCKND